MAIRESIKSLSTPVLLEIDRKYIFETVSPSFEQSIYMAELHDELRLRGVKRQFNRYPAKLTKEPNIVKCWGEIDPKKSNPINKMVQKFRKKPVVIEAIQLTEKNIFEVYSFVYGKPDLSHRIASDKWDDYENIVKRDGMKITTLEDGKNGQAEHIASIGDYIIKGIKGEFYPCKPDIFESTYDVEP